MSIYDLNDNFNAFVSALKKCEEKEAIIKIHTIKGAAQNASFDTLAKVALEIETDMKSQRVPVYPPKIDALKKTVLDTISEAKRFLNSPRS